MDVRHFPATASLVAATLLCSCATNPGGLLGEPPVLRAAPTMGANPAPHSPGLGLLKGNQDCGPTGAWAPLTITNTDSYRAAWVTFYDNRAGASGDIMYAACWNPGETRMACVDKINYAVRAEMVWRTVWVAARDCSDGTVTCDTQWRWSKGGLVDMSSGNAKSISIGYDGWQCRWQY